MEKIRLIEPSPNRTRQSFETFTKVQEQLTPLIRQVRGVQTIPGSDLVVASGRQLSFYDPSTHTTQTQEIPTTVNNRENSEVFAVVSADGKYVIAHRSNGPAHVFDGQTGLKYDFIIPPNQVEPIVLKRYEKSAKTPEELEGMKNRYCGIRGFLLSKRGRYTIVQFQNSTARVFDFKTQKYVSPALNIYGGELTFDDREDTVSYRENEFLGKGRNYHLELAYDADDLQEVPHEREISGYPHLQSYPQRNYILFDRSRDGYVMLKGILYMGKHHNRYAVGFEGENTWTANARIIYDVETGNRIDLRHFADYIADLTISADGKYAYYNTTLSGQPPEIESRNERNFTLKAIDLQTMKPILLPEIRLNTQRISQTVLPLDNKPEVIVVQENNQVIHLNIESITNDKKVSEFLEKTGDMSGEIMRIGSNLVSRGVVAKEEDRDLWVQFLGGQSGLTPEMLAQATKLQVIQLRDGGNAINSVAHVSLAHLSNSERLVFDNVSSVAQERSKAPRKLGYIPFMVKKDIRQLIEGAEKIEVYGRTVLITRGNQQTAIKLQREGEAFSPLVHEADQMNLLKSLKSKIGLISELPSPHFSDENYLRRIRLEYLPDDIRKQVENSINVYSGNNVAVGLVYDVPKGYFTYHHQLSDKEAKISSGKAVSDLFRLARVGYIHPDLIELFHNQIQLGRPDGGKYIWNIDVVRPMSSRFGAGRLHAWERTVDYPNFGPSGLRDFAELARFDEIYSPNLTNEHIRHLSTNLLRLPEEMREKVTLQYFLGNYMLAWTLAEGRRLRDGQGFTVDNLPNISTQIQRTFETAYRSFTGNELEEAFAGTKPISWERYAHQMKTFMTDEYAKWPAISEEVFGIQTRVSQGDGWGFIDRGLLTEKLTNQGFPDIEAMINKYFNVATSSRRQIPDNLLTFNRDYTAELLIEAIFGNPEGSIKNPPPKVILDLYKQYGRGMRANGRDGDLGPMNGPLPLTELINANYLVTTLAIADKP